MALLASVLKKKNYVRHDRNKNEDEKITLATHVPNTYVGYGDKLEIWAIIILEVGQLYFH